MTLVILRKRATGRSLNSQIIVQMCAIACKNKRETERERRDDRWRMWRMCFGMFLPLHGPPAWNLAVWATAVR